MRKYFAEFFGTFMLVFLGTGTVIFANSGHSPIGFLGIGLSFGLAITIMACTVGAISGGNFNPAVSLAMMINKRLAIKEGIFYVISQFIGAVVASAVISIFITAMKLPSNQFGQTDFNILSASQAFLFEIIITFLFVFVILMVTSSKYGNPILAPIAIGLVLAFLIIMALNLTGGSLNPARSFGPAIFAGGKALSHYWVYFFGPFIGAVLAAWVAKLMGSEE